MGHKAKAIEIVGPIKPRRYTFVGDEQLDVKDQVKHQASYNAEIERVEIILRDTERSARAAAVEKCIALIRHSTNNPRNNFPAQYKAGMLNAAAILAFEIRSAAGRGLG